MDQYDKVVMSSLEYHDNFTFQHEEESCVCRIFSVDSLDPNYGQISDSIKRGKALSGSYTQNQLLALIECLGRIHKIMLFHRFQYILVRKSDECLLKILMISDEQNSSKMLAESQSSRNTYIGSINLDSIETKDLSKGTGNRNWLKMISVIVAPVFAVCVSLIVEKNSLVK